MMVKFEGKIAKFELKTDHDECLVGKIILEFTPSDQLKRELVDIFRSQTTVNITLDGV